MCGAATNCCGAATIGGLTAFQIVLYGDCGERLSDLEALVTLIDIASLVILDLALIAGGVVLSIRLVGFLDRTLPMEADR